MEISLDEINSSPNNNIFNNNYIILETIGKGSFGTVLKAKEIASGNIVAVKKINLNKSKKNYETIIKEVNVLKGLNHPKIVKYLGYIEEGMSIYIIMEFLSGGTLKQFIENNNNKNSSNYKLNENITRIIIKQILSALSYLHYTCDICHRDIKPENIMFSEVDNINSIKVLDFGLSTENFESQNYLENCGTLIYMAPEQISNKTYSKGVDIWSVGIILYMMLFNGKNPFYNKGDNSDIIIEKITKDKIKFDCFNNPISWMAKHLISKMLNKIPNYRYSAQLALKHPWITENKYSKIPLTLYDKVKYNENVNKMKILFSVAIFISSMPNYKKNVIINYEEYYNKIKESNEVYNNLFKEKRNKMFDVIKLSRVNIKYFIENKPKTADNVIENINNNIDNKNNINNDNKIKDINRNKNEKNNNFHKLSKIKKNNILKYILNNKNFLPDLKSLSKEKKSNSKNKNTLDECIHNLNKNKIKNFYKKQNNINNNNKIIIESKNKNKPKTSQRKNFNINPIDNKKIIYKEYSSKMLINDPKDFNIIKLKPVKKLKTIHEISYHKK